MSLPPPTEVVVGWVAPGEDPVAAIAADASIVAVGAAEAAAAGGDAAGSVTLVPDCFRVALLPAVAAAAAALSVVASCDGALAGGVGGAAALMVEVVVVGVRLRSLSIGGGATPAAAGPCGGVAASGGGVADCRCDTVGKAAALWVASDVGPSAAAGGTCVALAAARDVFSSEESDFPKPNEAALPPPPAPIAAEVGAEPLLAVDTTLLLGATRPPALDVDTTLALSAVAGCDDGTPFAAAGDAARSWDGAAATDVSCGTPCSSVCFAFGGDADRCAAVVGAATAAAELFVHCGCTERYRGTG